MNGELPSDEFMRAMNGEREATRVFLAAIARGDPITGETLSWLRNVAAALLEADDTLDDKARPGLLVEALGMKGRRDRGDRREKLRAFIREQTRADGFADEDGVAHTPTRQIAELAMRDGLTPPGMDLQESTELIRLERKNL